MIDNDTTYASFLLRIWRIAETSSLAKDGRWECEVESVQSGQTWSVESLEMLLALLQEQVEETRKNGQALSGGK